MNRVRLQDLVIGIIVAIVGAIAFIKALSMPDATRPYTLFITGLFTFLGALLIIQSIIRRNVPLPEGGVVHAKSFGSPLMAFAFIALYALLLDKIGFFVSSALFMLALMFYLGYRRILTMLITVVGMLGFIYILFIYQLHVALPAGILF